MKNNFISRNHSFLGTYIGDFGDFHGDFSAKNPIITVRFGKYRCVLVRSGVSMDRSLAVQRLFFFYY